ncbi:ABC transporter permease [Sediminivirga luteola]|uniref:Molybdenum transport system permease n=1 Tax=Sediminivirga luteola TaxID=1774748 RepID=A0A8J2TW19_9MICO|nr:ABC transporter permease [Sediminivirga luteola]GGA06383.1 molybdate ABC transporter permease [Sediminivirga luteola]
MPNPSTAAARRRVTRPAAWPLLVPAAVGFAFLLLPLLGLLAAVPWTRLPEVLGRREVAEALGLSLVSATSAALLCLVLGVPLAWWLSRMRFRGHGFVRALVLVPLVMPPVVGGTALLSTFGRSGLIGAPLHQTSGITVPYSTPAVIMAATFVSMPFLVVAVEGTLRGLDPRLETAARALGASRWYAFRRVLLPAVAPGVAAGMVLAWARALGEFGATIAFAGNLPGTTQTLPLAIYLSLSKDPAAASALSLVLLVASLLAIGLAGSAAPIRGGRR